MHALHTLAPAMEIPGLSTVKEIASGPKLPVFHVFVVSHLIKRLPVE